MSERSDSYYSQNFMERAQCGREAAKMLEDDLMNFDTGLLQDKLDELHKIERGADKKEHRMMGVLIRVFTTPVEREDTILLNQSTDEVTDRIEDALVRIYINSVHTIKPEVARFTKVTIHRCNILKGMIEELTDFKRSRILHGLIIEIGALEERGDRMFINPVRELHVEAEDPIEIIAWREIYVYLERCHDACEYMVDIAESVITENT